MKRCPNCNQLFTDDNSFCLEDGTMLVFATESAQNPQIFPASGEMPTQFIQTPLKTAAPRTAAKDSSKWLFLVIGVLATALAAATIFIFINPGGENKNDAENLSVKTTNSSSETNQITEDLPKNEQTFAKEPLKTTPAPTNNQIQKQKDPNLTPAGNWAGDWNGKGAYYTAVMSLNETGGKVSGQIVWTLQNTGNQKRTSKIGATATEYVQGNFNPATRKLSLRGIRKDDPAGIVILDTYNLTLAENNQTISGRSKNGSFNLRR